MSDSRHLFPYGALETFPRFLRGLERHPPYHSPQHPAYNLPL